MAIAALGVAVVALVVAIIALLGGQRDNAIARDRLDLHLAKSNDLDDRLVELEQQDNSPLSAAEDAAYYRLLADRLDPPI